MRRFLFATGIECSNPKVRGRRVDELEATDHYRRYAEDLRLIPTLGIRVVRYGPPLHRTFTGPGGYDWSFFDAAMSVVRELGLTVIADLCHFGLPEWLGDFQNPEWPRYFAEYAEAFARRYPDIRYFTPVNEMFVCATFSALYGWWNEGLASQAAFVTALKHLCLGNLLARQAIERVSPEAVFIQSESTEYFLPAHPDALEHAAFHNQRRFLALDFTYGHDVSARMYRYLMENGMSPDDYLFFMRNGSTERCLMGNDYYVTNEHLIEADGSIRSAGDVLGYFVITRQYYDRYRLPVMHTETNWDGEEAVNWLWRQAVNVVHLMIECIPVIGFTWYSLLDQVDWDTALQEANGRVNAVGLFDLNRQLRPVGAAYRELIARWQDYIPLPSLYLDPTHLNR